MANTFVVARSHLIYGVCLPLAVLIGYLLAEPQDTGSRAVVFLVFSVLCIPLLMRWHHPLLVFSCNALIIPFFIPGHPSFTMVMAFLSLFVTLLNRSMGQKVQFFGARSVAHSLLFIGLVVVLTAHFTGGIGFHTFGAANFGGRKYLNLLTGIVLFFALAALKIKPSRAGLYIGLFFLSSLTSLISYLAAIAGPSAYFLAELFPIEGALEETRSSGPTFLGADLTRYEGLTSASMGILCFVMARYGARGLLDLGRPWRMGIFLIALVAGLYTGFRSNVIVFPLLFMALFYLEGLFRTRYFFMLLAGITLTAAVVLPNTNRLPLSMQRALSFLPINVDPAAEANAEGSTTWRVEMWKRLLPEIPKYLIKGKGYALNPDELFMMTDVAQRGGSNSADVAMVTGDYHNGPLSVILPFGIFGVLGFLWFLSASTRALYLNYRFGDPYLHRINTFLLGYFIVRILFFFVIFGSLHSDLPVFAGLVGLGVSLNGGVSRPPKAAAEIPAPEDEE